MTAQIVGLLGLAAAVVVVNAVIGLTAAEPVRATVRPVDDQERQR